MGSHRTDCIPILRQGGETRADDVSTVVHYRTGEPYVEVGQATPDYIRKDLKHQSRMREALAAMPLAQLLDVCQSAADYFLNGTLPAGSAEQSPSDYRRDVAATTGWPEMLVARTMQSMHAVLCGMEQVLQGLARGQDLTFLDAGKGMPAGSEVSYSPSTEALGVLLPSSAPRVHPLWVPALPLKTPIILRPGAADPWTPFRLIQAFVKAGAPAEAFAFYPCDGGGGQEILRHCGRGMAFIDTGTAAPWPIDSRVNVHGAGHSKIIIGEDCADDWERYLDVLAASVMDSAGRSPVKASGIWVTRHGSAIAEALASRLSTIRPRATDDPDAELAPFLQPSIAEKVSSMIDVDLHSPGAEDLTSRMRGSGRLVTCGNCAYLLPTVVQCGPMHMLADREFAFPYVSVVEVRESQMPDVLGHSLVVTAITDNPRLRHRLLTSPLIGHVNFGPVPTTHVPWDQPVEGNLFEHLYARQGFEAA